MNVKATLSPEDLARACADAMWKDDDASRGLGMEIVEIKAGPGDAGDDGPAAHGQRPAHRPWRLYLCAGGFRLRLCLQLPQRARGRRASATSPSSGRASSAIVLVATAREISRSGRSGIYDVRVTVGDAVIAEFRGHSRTIGGTWLPQPRNRHQAKISFEGKRPMASTNLQSRASGYIAEMDEAERASRDEIMALQTRRLAWSLAHAYDNVAHYKQSLRQGRRASVGFQATLGSRQISVHGEDRSARQLSVQHVRGAARKTGARSRLLRHHRQADRGRLYPGRHRDVVGR